MKRVLTVLLCLFLLSQGCMAFAAEAPVYTLPANVPADSPTLPYCRFGILYEETTGTVLFAKQPERTNAPASMTKVMTALLVLEHNPTLEGSYVVPAVAVSEKYCYWMETGHLESGEEVSIRELMNYLLIVSGNEAATTLAHYVCGDIDAFIQKMNDRAKELGMTKTHYADPHGLSEQNRLNSFDQLTLIREAMKHELFREIVSTKSGQLPVSNKRSAPLRYSNTNRVMNPRNTLEYQSGFEEDIIGVKTGYIKVAGRNLSCCMDYDEEDLLFYSVVMNGRDVAINGETRQGHYLDTIELMRWARTFHKEGVASGEQVAMAATKGSREDNIQLVAESEALLLTQTAVQKTVTLNEIGKEVKAGDVLGILTLTDDFGNVKEVNLLAAADAVTEGGMTVVLIAAAALVSVAIVIVFAKKGKAAKAK